MTVLDADAVIAFLLGEPAGAEVEPLLRRRDRALTTIGAAEVVDHLVRMAGVDEEEAVLDLAQLRLLRAIDVDWSIGTAAGRLRARHHHRTRAPISLADCVAAEAARALGEPLATSDPALLAVCHAEGIDSVVLPQSDGSRWAPTTA